MAITIERQKDGSMKTTKRTGFDKLSFKFGNTLERIKSGARKTVKKAVKKSKAKSAKIRREKARKEIRDIERGFGTVEKYVEFNPDFRGRAERLRKLAK
jgi:hypothetical protein